MNRQALGWVMVFIVVYQSLGREALPPPDIQHGDKWAHLLAYFVLTAWFSQLYIRARHKWCLLAFIALGVTLEFIQGLTAYRMMDVAEYGGKQHWCANCVVCCWICKVFAVTC